jgi:hypothetical protein
MAIESARGWGGVGANGHTSKQRRDKKNVTFIGPKSRARKKDTNLMLLRRLSGVKKGTAVKRGMMCRGVWGIWGHLLNVSRDFGTFWNPPKNGCKA